MGSKMTNESFADDELLPKDKEDIIPEDKEDIIPDLKEEENNQSEGKKSEEQQEEKENEIKCDNNLIMKKLDTIIELLQKENIDEKSSLDLTKEIELLKSILKDNEKAHTLLDDYSVKTEEIRKAQEVDHQLLKENLSHYYEFTQQVRTNMNNENIKLKKQLDGTVLNPLLGNIATIYCENYQILNDKKDYTNEDYKKQIRYILESLEDILYENDCEFRQTKIGEIKPTKACKIKGDSKQFLTADSSQHRVVKESFNPGIVRKNVVLYPEYVHIYCYDEEFAEKEKIANKLENENIENSEEMKIKEESENQGGE